MGLLQKVIDRDDFKETSYIVIFKNDTSGTKMFDTNSVSIIQFITGKTDGITLTVPLNSCQIKHSLILYFFEGPLTTEINNKIKAGDFKDTIEMIGKVISLGKDSDDPDCKEVVISVEFTQYDEKFWKKLVEKFEKLQKGMTDLVAYKNR